MCFNSLSDRGTVTSQHDITSSINVRLNLFVSLIRNISCLIAFNLFTYKIVSTGVHCTEIASGTDRLLICLVSALLPST